MYAVLIHAHQKINRLALRRLHLLTPRSHFPTIRQILHFEGKNGPDAVKLKKSTDCEQPWHFVNPFDLEDTALVGYINDHYKDLVQALQDDDMVRAAFEAAWLAHSLVDGLTPAHHYPYEKELEDLRGGEDRDSRKGLVGRAYVKGDTAIDSMVRSLKLIGPNGLLTNHTLFEAGVYMIMMPLRIRNAVPTPDELAELRQIGVAAYFERQAREVAAHDLFERYCQAGWTPKLVRDVQRELIPRMVKTVVMAWYAAQADAGLAGVAE